MLRCDDDGTMESEMHPAERIPFQRSLAHSDAQAASFSYSMLCHLTNLSPNLLISLVSAFCDGQWRDKPPQSVFPQSEAFFCATSDKFCWGVEGEALFRVRDVQTGSVACELQLDFDVPAVGPNRISIQHPDWLPVTLDTGRGDHTVVKLTLNPEPPTEPGLGMRKPPPVETENGGDMEKMGMLAECSLCGGRFMTRAGRRMRIECERCGERLVVRARSRHLGDTSSSSECDGVAYLTKTTCIQPDQSQQA
eukprot:TRINITY_DN9614_c0_g1_i15.p1 TRINITY_DN9614_c0_g1~~TRINITY_DN9614_c0_g1_i15.p1  ORF type:complete len:251 (+),score=38.25 TRINITY_DN9614_c0_g1_i15:171-923(+)